MEQWRINFSQNLRHLRQVHGINQKEMANILGVSVSTYGKIERCDSSVRIHGGRICRVCAHFQITADDLLHQNWPQILQCGDKPSGAGAPKAPSDEGAVVEDD